MTHEQPQEPRERPMQEHAHWRCDCVPDLGPAHCHRCSRIQGRAVAWEQAPCAEYAETALLAAETALAVRPRMEGEALADEVAALMVDLLVAGPGTGRAESAEGADNGEQPLPQEDEPAPAPAPSPAPGPRPKAPAERLVSAAEAHAAKEPPAPWRMTALAREQAEQFGVTPREVVERVLASTVKYHAPRGGISHYCDDLLVLVAEEEECVISIVEREHPEDDGQGPRGARQAPAALSPHRAKSGGPGRRNPSSTKEMFALLKEHGFSSEIGSKGHYLVTHPDHPGKRFSVPSTPSDKRSLPNCVAQIKRDTGIDVTLRADGRR